VIEHNLDVIKPRITSSISAPKAETKVVRSSAPSPRKNSLKQNSYTGEYLKPVLQDQRAVGHHPLDRKRLELLERENLAALDDLAKGDRIAVEA
jgi:hypothetical protein